MSDTQPDSHSNSQSSNKQLSTNTLNQNSFSADRVKQVWQQAQEKLKLQLSPAAYSTWIASNPLTSLNPVDQSLVEGVISTPTAFHATNLKKNLYTQLKSAIEQVLNKTVQLEFKVQDPAQVLAQQKKMSSKQADRSSQNQSSFNNLERQQPKSHSNQSNPGYQSSPSSSPNTDSSSDFSSSQSGQSGSSATSNSPSFKTSFNQSNTQSPSVEDLFSEQSLQSAHQDRALTAARRAGIRLDYRFKSFAVSSSNEMAHAAATAVSKRPGSAYNPLFLYGGVGVGKTHLMHAIGNAVLERDPATKIIYCTGEEFTNEIINAIKTKKAIKFKRKFRTAQILMIDDIQFIAGKNTVQEEFFHTFNALIQNSSQIILTSDRPPQEINLMEDRLVSRFEAGLMVDIQQPSLELRTAIVLIKSRAKNISLPINLAEQIANSVEGARKIEGIITSIRSAVELRNLEVNQDLIEDILAKEKAKNGQSAIRLKPQKIIKKVCEYYQLEPSVVKGKRRNKEFVRARHLAMYLLKTELDMSYVEIGRWFSNRDHTSVMHAKNKLDGLLNKDESIQEDFSTIKTTLVKMSN